MVCLLLLEDMFSKLGIACDIQDLIEKKKGKIGVYVHCNLMWVEGAAATVGSQAETFPSVLLPRGLQWPFSLWAVEMPVLLP